MEPAVNEKATAWAEAQAKAERADEGDWALKMEADRLLREYLVENPLPESMRETIRALYSSGARLCCHGGKKRLEEVMDDPRWVHHINDMAYDSLGCSKSFKPGGDTFEEGKERLERILNGNGGWG